MRQLILIITAVVTLTTTSLSQNTPTDSQTMRAILDEVRLLRRDLQTTAVASQRVQIALYRLQLQDAAVARASKPFEEAQVRVTEIAAARKHMAAELERLQEAQNRAQDAHERKTIEEEALPELKRHLEQAIKEEEQWQARKNDAEAQLRTEQGKLNDLHNLVDQLDAALQAVGRVPDK